MKCDHGHDVLRCNECGTLFEPEVADRRADGEARCPQCFLSSYSPAGEPAAGDFVIRTTTPFR